MTQRFTLKKHERLKSHKQLDKLFQSARSKFSHPFKLLYLIEDKETDAWPLLFSISVPKKKVPSAVKRNLIKRRAREAYRKNKLLLQNLLTESGNNKISLMFIFIETQTSEYQLIEKSIKNLLKQLEKELAP